MIGPAQESLEKLAETEPESFDFAFLDADKPNYPILFEKILPLVKKGGLIAVDNVLWYGAVINPTVR
jgi:predicted O-methyltransferase YrrM